MLVDTHCHINFETYDDDRVEMIERAMEEGVRRLVCIGMQPEGARSALKLARKYPGRIFTSAGIHPYDALTCTPEILAELEALLAEPEMVLCGEMGLDTVKADVPMPAQEHAFAEQLKLAQRTNKPVCIHSRDAFQQVRKVIEQVGAPARGGFAHCFSDGWEEAQAWVELGFKISFAGQITFENKSCEPLREAARRLRPEDVVVETDSPFLSPHPKRGRRNEPSHVRHTANKLAELWDMPVAEVEAITTRNACEVLGIPFE